MRIKYTQSLLVAIVNIIYTDKNITNNTKKYKLKKRKNKTI